MAIEPVVQKVIDESGKIVKNINRLANIHVMVGVPSTRAPRETDPTTGKIMPISNAALAYIHEFGSPLANIPPRPFLVPGVQRVLPVIAARFRSAAKAALDGNWAAMMQQLSAAGQTAATSVQQKIIEGPFVPLAPSTIARRRAKLMGTTSLTASQRAAGFADIKPLFDTGQMRRSITYVVRDRKGRNIG